MGKNTNGGKRAKSMSRKGQVSVGMGMGVTRMSTCEEEKYGIVTKLLGGGNCLVRTVDGRERLMHIRGKFAGRERVGKDTYVLVGVRGFESSDSRNCDLLEVYNGSDVAYLSGVAGLADFFSIRSSDLDGGGDSGVIFSNCMSNCKSNKKPDEGEELVKEPEEERVENIEFDFDDI
jgi:initiation factor 1A